MDSEVASGPGRVCISCFAEAAGVGDDNNDDDDDDVERRSEKSLPCHSYCRSSTASFQYSGSTALS